MDPREHIIIREGRELNELLVLMLHGWSGDERSMWVFQDIFPPTSLIVSVRGLYPAVGGGYQWIAESPSIEVICSQLQSAIVYLREFLEEIKLEGYSTEKLILVGFSQGAALAFAAMEDLNPDMIVSIAGFIPSGCDWERKPGSVYWGHGVQDEHVPIERARADVKFLRDKGIEVAFCEADVGHKLGLECTRGLKEWLLSSTRKET